MSATASLCRQIIYTLDSKEGCVKGQIAGLLFMIAVEL